MVFQIVYSPEAVDHLAVLSKAEQVRAIDEVVQQLNASADAANATAEVAAAEFDRALGAANR